jgi:hypothetical protein
VNNEIKKFVSDRDVIEINPGFATALRKTPEVLLQYFR